MKSEHGYVQSANRLRYIYLSLNSEDFDSQSRTILLRVCALYEARVCKCSFYIQDIVHFFVINSPILGLCDTMTCMCVLSEMTTTY